MLRRLVWMVSSCTLAACSVGLTFPSNAIITCATTSECPSGLVCVIEGRQCVAPGTSCVEQRDDGYHAAPNGTSCGLGSATGVCNDGLCGLCGNGVRESGEACDDGNPAEDDGCTTLCEIAVCGDGVLTARAEECDDANNNSNDACAGCKQVVWDASVAFGLGPRGTNATRRTLSDMSGMAASRDGAIYITQAIVDTSGVVAQSSGYLLQVSESTGTILRVAGKSTVASEPRAETGIGRETALERLTGVTVDANGLIYVAEDGFSTYILSIDAKNVLRLVAGTGARCGSGPCGDGGFARAAELIAPGPMALDQAGELYFVDGYRIRYIDRAGRIHTAVGKDAPCDGARINACNGSIGNASFGSIGGLAFDARNRLYIGDRYSGLTQSPSDTIGFIRRVDFAAGGDGAVTTLFGGLNNLTTLTGDGRTRVYYAAHEGSAGSLFAYDTELATTSPLLGDNPCKIGVPCGDGGPPADAGSSTIVGIAPQASRTLIIDENLRRLRSVEATKVSNLLASPLDGNIIEGSFGTSTRLPAVAMTAAPNGDIYVATSSQVFKWSVTTTAVSLVAGKRCPEDETCPKEGAAKDVQFGTLSDIATDGVTVYVADEGQRRVYAIADGVVTALAGSGQPEPATAQDDTMDARTLGLRVSGLALHDGKLLLTTNYSIWSVNPTTREATRIIGDSYGAPLRCPNDVVQDTNGDYYVADRCACSVTRVRNGEVAAYVGTGAECCSAPTPPNPPPNCGTASSTGSFKPDTVALDGTTLAIGERAGDSVSVVSTGATALPVARTRLNGDSANYDNVPIAQAQLKAPRVAYAPDHTLLLLERDMPTGTSVERSIRRVTSSGRVITVIGDVDDTFTGPFALAGLVSPTQAVMYSPTQVLIMDSGEGAVRRVDLAARTVDVVGGSTFGGPLGTEPYAARWVGMISGPRALAVTPDRKSIFTGSGNNGLIVTDASAGADASLWVTAIAGALGTALKTDLSWDALAMNLDGTKLYVCDTPQNVIWQLSIATGGGLPMSAGAATPYAGQPGFVGATGDGGQARVATLDGPQALVTAPATGTLYIADTGNHRVRRVLAGGTIETVIGTGVAATDDDLRTAAGKYAIEEPSGLAFDAFGNLVVTGRGVVRIVLANGASGEPDSRSTVATIYNAAAHPEQEDLVKCLKVPFNGLTDDTLFAADSCSGAVIEMRRR